jgi:hypothetical protein
MPASTCAVFVISASAAAPLPATRPMAIGFESTVAVSAPVALTVKPEPPVTEPS